MIEYFLAGADRFHVSPCENSKRGVAQFGRALRSGRRGRKFESCHLDQKRTSKGCPFLIELKGLNKRPQVPNVVRDAKTSGGRFRGAFSRAERGCDLIEAACSNLVTSIKKGHPKDALFYFALRCGNN